MASYLSETAGSIMARDVPVTKESMTVAHVLHMLSKDNWDDMHSVVVVSEHGFLLGIVSVHTLLISKKEKLIKDVMEKVALRVHPTVDQEQVVIQAIHNDVQFVPVVDHDNRFLGAVTAEKIIDILHQEHLEDLLHTSGIHGKVKHMSELITADIPQIIIARIPWLFIGLGVGFIASLIVSRFEHFLDANVQIAFFISMVAYMSGAMNTQSEIMFIRALAVMKFDIARYLVREFFIGFLMGLIIGVIAATGAFILSGMLSVAMAVGLSILTSMSLATILACGVPLLLRAWGKDPAIGSGPFATALQDLLSITVYFVISYLILSGV